MIHPDEVFPPYTLRVFSNAFTRTDIHFRPSQGIHRWGSWGLISRVCGSMYTTHTCTGLPVVSVDCSDSLVRWEGSSGLAERSKRHENFPQHLQVTHSLRRLQNTEYWQIKTPSLCKRSGLLAARGGQAEKRKPPTLARRGKVVCS